MAVPVIEVVSGTTYASRTNTVITAPSGITNDDLLILFQVVGLATPPVPTPPAGFALLPGSWPKNLVDSGGFDINSYAWFKIASGESGDYTVTHTACSSQGIMLRISGADTADPFGPDPAFQGFSFGESPPNNTQFLGLTTEAADTLIILRGTDWGDTANNLTPPAGFTEVFDQALTHISWQGFPSIGAIGPWSEANNSNDGTNPWGALTVAVKSNGLGGSLNLPPFDYSRFPKFKLRSA